MEQPNLDHPHRIKRFGAPNLYDMHPYGTICEVSDGSLYKQISKDQDNPIWDKLTDDIINQFSQDS